MERPRTRWTARFLLTTHPWSGVCVFFGPPQDSTPWWDGIDREYSRSTRIARLAVWIDHLVHLTSLDVPRCSEIVYRHELSTARPSPSARRSGSRCRLGLHFSLRIVPRTRPMMISRPARSAGSRRGVVCRDFRTPPAARGRGSRRAACCDAREFRRSPRAGE